MNFAKLLVKISCFCLIVSQLSCRKDFSSIKSNGNLGFSTDTLILDTVFNNLSTTTKNLIVYNRSNNDLSIANIKLAKANSRYRMNVNGIPGTNFNDVLILKKDSIFIKIEATIPSSATNSEMVYEDQILFDSDGSPQSVKLITLVTDAHFLFPNSGTDFNLTETTFTKEKPYVIYGNATVASGNSLEIQAGSVVHFHKNASLTIASNATLQVNGTLTDSIVFEDDKLSFDFNQVPGQWEGVKIEENASATINYLKILNATTALNIVNNSSTTSINNTEIHKASRYGIYAQNANITARNLVIGQTGKSGLFLQGGDYTFKHCTFGNYWNKGNGRNTENIVLANYYINNMDVITNAPLNTSNFTNCIATGLLKDELLLDKTEDEPVFNFNFKNCLINLERTEDLYDINNEILYTDVLLNKITDFRNTNENDFRIGLQNEGINKADASVASQVPLDIAGTDRTENPDIGAYQHIDFETLETDQEDE